MELGAAAMTSKALAAAGRSARVARRQITSAIDDPELRRKVTPRDEVGCKRIMLTDEWYPTLTQPNVELVTDRIAEITPTGIRTEDGIERPADVLVLATGFKTPRASSRRWRSSAPAAARWPRSGRDVARAYLGHERPRLPEPVPALRAEHQRRHGLGHLHDRGRPWPT